MKNRRYENALTLTALNWERKTTKGRRKTGAGATPDSQHFTTSLRIFFHLGKLSVKTRPRLKRQCAFDIARSVAKLLMIKRSGPVMDMSSLKGLLSRGKGPTTVNKFAFAPTAICVVHNKHTNRRVRLRITELAMTLCMCSEVSLDAFFVNRHQAFTRSTSRKVDLTCWPSLVAFACPAAGTSDCCTNLATNGSPLGAYDERGVGMLAHIKTSGAHNCKMDWRQSVTIIVPIW